VWGAKAVKLMKTVQLDDWIAIVDCHIFKPDLMPRLFAEVRKVYPNTMMAEDGDMAAIIAPKDKQPLKGSVKGRLLGKLH
jgi:hypothetical protein